VIGPPLSNRPICRPFRFRQSSRGPKEISWNRASFWSSPAWLPVAGGQPAECAVGIGAAARGQAQRRIEMTLGVFLLTKIARLDPPIAAGSR